MRRLYEGLTFTKWGGVACETISVHGSLCNHSKRGTDAFHFNLELDNRDSRSHNIYVSSDKFGFFCLCAIFSFLKVMLFSVTKMKTLSTQTGGGFDLEVDFFTTRVVYAQY